MIKVIKRSGSVEELDPSKYTKVCEWACEGITGVSASDLAFDAYHRMHDNISTKDLHESIIETAVNKITTKTPNYDKVAARLVIFQIRKDVYGGYTPPPLYEIVKKNVEGGFYTEELLEWYSKEDFDQMDLFIKHERDNEFTYAATEQLRAKYLVQDRSTKTLYESPQVTYMLIAATLFHSESVDKRIGIIKDYYNEQSNFMFSIPTPIAAGVRTPVKQFSSCCLIPVADSLDSICSAGTSIVKYVSQKAGIGVDLGQIRAVGSKVRDGSIAHTGVLPFIKKFKGDLKSCSQGGLRGGAATVYYPWWHYEFPELIVLKNNAGTEESRERHVDYGVQINNLLWERFFNDEDITLFSPHEVPQIKDAFYRGGGEEFKRVYEEAEKNPLLRKRTMSAKDVVYNIASERQKTGRIYIVFMDNFVGNSPFEKFKKNQWMTSNLCVAPETEILTDVGYVRIEEVVNECVNVWNGREFSKVTVRKTGENQHIIKIVTDSGQSLSCTPYHKFYVFNGYGNPYVEKRAGELKAGDKLMKFDLPIIEGEEYLPDAYVNGFYSGDGCLTPSGQRIYLYGEKRKLRDLFTCKFSVQEDQDREYGHYHTLKDKFFVPLNSYTIQSRLDWLAGFLDADGCVYRNGTNEAFTASSINLDFLQQIQKMLQTLGVDSKIKLLQDEGYRPLPANDGTGEMRDFFCQVSYRLLISSGESQKLLDMGLETQRLTMEKRIPQRDARRFIKVNDVIDEGRFDDTYCFNEPKRHLGMFNGILTGQCIEIALPVSSFESLEDPNGQIALCTLSSANWGKLNKPSDLEKPCRSMVRALDNLLSYQEYPVEAARRFTEDFRALGVGVVGFAHFLAKRGLKYNIQAAEVVDEYAEAMAYYLIDESVNLAKERGRCNGFEQTCYARGVFPWEKRNKNIDTVVKHTLRYNWEELREKLLKYGIRNATLMAIAPTESSSILLGETNGIEAPLFDIVEKKSKDGSLKQVVPEHHHLRNKYDYRWDQVDNKGYLLLMGVLQKWIDQSISSNTNYNPVRFSDNKIPLSVLVQDMVFANELGIKSLYYQNMNDMIDEPDNKVIETEEVCETCVI